MRCERQEPSLPRLQNVSPIAPPVRQVIAPLEFGHPDYFVEVIADVLALNRADKVLLLLVQPVKALDALPQDRQGELLGGLAPKGDQAVDGVADDLSGLVDGRSGHVPFPAGK